MPKLNIPEALQKYTDGISQLTLEASSLMNLVACLKDKNPELYRVLFDSQGKLCGYANLYLEGELVSNQLNSKIELTPDSRLTLVAAVSGG